MKAVQKSCKDGKITFMGVGPMESASGVESAQRKPGDDPDGQGGQGRRELLVVQEHQHQREDDDSDDEIDVVFGEPAGKPVEKHLRGDDQLDALSQEDESERELDAAHDRLGEQLGELVDHAGQREHEQERAEDDAGGGDHRFGDHRRIGDGDGAHGLQGLHRHRQPVVIPRDEVKQPEGQEDRRWAQLVDQNHADDDGQQRAQVAEGAGKLDPVESQGAVVGLRRICGGRFCSGWSCPSHTSQVLMTS